MNLRELIRRLTNIADSDPKKLNLPVYGYTPEEAVSEEIYPITFVDELSDRIDLNLTAE